MKSGFACHGLILGVTLVLSQGAATAQVPPANEGPAASTRPDLSKLQLSGDGRAQDSFSLVMQAVARSFGRPADYEAIYALSANSFAPCVVLTEGECRGGRWLARGRERGLGLVANALGLTVTPLELPEFTDDGRLQADLNSHMKAIAPVILKRLQQGEVVVTTGGVTGNGYEYTRWAIIVDAREDGTVLASGVNGRRDNQMAWAESLWAISKGDDPRSAEESDILMLRDAIERINDVRPASEGGPGPKPVWGLNAIDKWEQQMARVPYCLDCKSAAPAAMAGDLAEAAASVSHGARVTSAYLRKQLPSFTDASRRYVERVAQHYDRIVELLRPFEDRERCALAMGDVTKQKALAAEVLPPVRTELSAAAKTMAEALVVIEEHIMERAASRAAAPGAANKPDAGDGK